MKWMLVCLCSVLFFACNSDDDTEKPDESNVKLLKKISDEDGAITFKYNDKSQLVEYSDNESEDWGYIITLTYDAKNELVSTLTKWKIFEMPLSMTYSKSGNTITCSGQENEKGEIRNVTYIVTINEQGLPSKIQEPYQSSRTYEFDNNGNPISEDWRNDGSSISGTLWKAKFDQKKGLLSACTTPKWWWYQHGIWWEYLNNNPTEISYTKGDAYKWTNSYTYNNQGYPSSAVIEELDTIFEYYN